MRIREICLGLLLAGLAFGGCVEKNSISDFLTEAGVDLSGGGNEGLDTLFILQTPVWGPNPARPKFNYDFNRPEKVFVGREPLVYVADTGNDRIVMLDTFGNILGFSKPIPHPVDITQDPLMRLIIVNGTSKIYVINLFGARHDISVADIDTIFGTQQQNHFDCENPGAGGCWKFTGISVYGDNEWYVTSTGPRTKNRMIFQFEPYDTTRTDPYRGPLPFEVGGTGFFGVTDPTGIISMPWSIDFVFTQKGNNSFKVQWIASGGETSTYGAFLDPTQGYDIYGMKFRQPSDAAWDESRSLYVIDAASDSMYKFSNNGALLHTLGPVSSAFEEYSLSGTVLSDGITDSLGASPVLQGSVTLYLETTVDTTAFMSDNGRGKLEGWGGTGTIDYENGYFSVEFSDSLKDAASGGGIVRIGYEVKGLNEPKGISVFDRTVYIADTGNDRIVRYKLSTDIR